MISFIERVAKHRTELQGKTHKKHNKYNETTIMKSDSGTEHGRKRIGILWFGGDERKF